MKSISDSIPHISFAVQFWDKEVKQYGKGDPSFTLVFATQKAAGNILAKGALGFAEEYMDGFVRVEGSFEELMRLGATTFVKDLKVPFGTKLAILQQHVKSLDSLKNTPQNISHHYDRGNDFFRLFLDESLTYSCAYFHTPKDSLEKAQEQKYEHVCRKLGLQNDETIVDIGCGWGGMLIYAAQHYGVKGTGCTLSREQAALATERVKKAGLEGRIEILLEDYRKIKGRFDKFISIGMFEHVGKKFIPVFMETTKNLLKTGGAGLLHTIGKEINTMDDPWTMKFIFPGGHIPILDNIIKVMGEKRLVPVDIENLRTHYAMTLDEWARRFEANMSSVETMFDDRFVRMWRMYLKGSSANFRFGDLRLYQILFTNGLSDEIPLTREYMYKSR